MIIFLSLWLNVSNSLYNAFRSIPLPNHRFVTRPMVYNRWAICDWAILMIFATLFIPALPPNTRIATRPMFLHHLVINVENIQWGTNWAIHFSIIN